MATKRRINEQVAWGVEPCEFCPNAAQGILDETQLVCFDCLERVLDRAEAVHIYPGMRATLPSFSDQFNLG